MLNEKKYRIEIEKLKKIIDILRTERNTSISNYQKLGEDFNELKELLVEFSKNINDKVLKKKYLVIRKKFKIYF